MLEQPLLVRGQLSHPRAGVLVREVQSPYTERTTVADGRVEVVRDGERERRFSLRNAPELAALLAGFEGMVTGERALLERHYSMTLQREGDSWLLTLVPRDPRSARRVEELRLSGRGRELLCTEVRQPEGQGSRMLVGPAAARADADAADLAALFADACR